MEAALNAPVPVVRETVTSVPSNADPAPVPAPVHEEAPPLKPVVEEGTVEPALSAAALEVQVAVPVPPTTEAPLPTSAPADTPLSPEQTEAAGDAHLDADLAITLGRPKKSAAPTGSLTALLGGKSMLVEVEEKKEERAVELSDTSHLDGVYNAEAVQRGWAALSEHLRGQNRVGLAATLLGGDFLFEDPTIRFTVSNEVQYEEMKECAAELLHFVRTHVGNGKLSLELFVSEVEAAPAFLSPKDRYTKWAEENPALEVLRKRLDLDLG